MPKAFTHYIKNLDDLDPFAPNQPTRPDPLLFRSHPRLLVEHEGRYLLVRRRGAWGSLQSRMPSRYYHEFFMRTAQREFWEQTGGRIGTPHYHGLVEYYLPYLGPYPLIQYLLTVEGYEGDLRAATPAGEPLAWWPKEQVLASPPVLCLEMTDHILLNLLRENRKLSRVVVVMNRGKPVRWKDGAFETYNLPKSLLDAPDKPDTPDAPDKPDTPDAPDKPDAPDAPDKPDAPDQSDQSDQSDKPDYRRLYVCEVSVNGDLIPFSHWQTWLTSEPPLSPSVMEEIKKRVTDG